MALRNLDKNFTKTHDDDDDDDDVYWTVSLRLIMNDYITDTVLMRKPMARLSPKLKRTEEQGTHF